MLEGHLLNERYRIKRRIGGGGMANVYLARDIILNRDVAIKVLRMEYANDPEFIERFDREAQAASSLAHPNIVNIYDVGEEEHILYIVMEYVDGFTLKEYIMKHGPLAVEEALDIMKQLTGAIQHAHVNGIVHRDIKPQNVLIDHYGNVKVTDFGIAMALSATALTQTNSILGSVHYLSPEQARGGMATKKSDIYSLGIVLYELLSGQLPFSGHSPISIALQHLQDDTPSVRDLQPTIPQSVENIVLKATTKDPFHRYRSVAEMEEALIQALEPAYINEAVFQPPFEAGEETKAIPIITDENLAAENEETTLVHPPQKGMNKQHPKVEKPKKKRSRKKWFIAAFLAILFIATIIVILVLTAPKDVILPDLTDYEYDDAVEELEKRKLKTKREPIFSEDIEEGNIVKTDPAAGRTVKEKTTVTLFVSDGKETHTIEDYVGKTFSQTVRLLEKMGYNVKSYEVVSEKPVGEIVTQIEPKAGSKVVPSDTTVVFEVSSGPKKISLGNLIGLTIEQAKEYTSNNGLKLDVSEDYSNTIEKGKVSKQSPSPNSEVGEGSTVKVTVSLGQKELPPKSHKATFVVPFRPQTDSDGKIQTEQKVQIYVGDMNNNITEVFHEDVIRNDKQYELTLIIAENEVAEYRVIRDGEELMHQKIPY